MLFLNEYPTILSFVKIFIIHMNVLTYGNCDFSTLNCHVYSSFSTNQTKFQVVMTMYEFSINFKVDASLLSHGI